MRIEIRIDGFGINPLKLNTFPYPPRAGDCILLEEFVSKEDSRRLALERNVWTVSEVWWRNDSGGIYAQVYCKKAE